MFYNAGELQQFVVCYKMSVERCLKTMAMDPLCTFGCSERPIYELGGNSCTKRCQINATKALT